MEEMMSNRKNTVAEKQVAKPVAKPVANTVHNHSDLEQQISELKKELKQAITIIDRVNNTSMEMSAKIESLLSNIKELKISANEPNTAFDPRMKTLIQAVKSSKRFVDFRSKV
jgi:phage shock protein A|tara:strand:- start:230 stop:568 length:339 start_codon:yes stop_codon:yes gene_type:complete